MTVTVVHSFMAGARIMGTTVHPGDWEKLLGILNDATVYLNEKKGELADKGISHFRAKTTEYGMDDLKDLGERFHIFLKRLVLPRWDQEATATLSFAMGALVEKMQMYSYTEKLSSGLSEIYEFLEMYEEEVQEPSPDLPLEPGSKVPSEGIPDRVDARGASAPSVGEAEEPPVDIEALLEAGIPDRVDARGASAPSVGEAEEPPVDIEALLEAESALREADIALPVEANVEAGIAVPERTKPEAVQPRIAVDESRAEECPAESTASVPIPEPLPASEERQDSAGLQVVCTPWEVTEPARTPENLQELYMEFLRLDPTSRVFVQLADQLRTRQRWEEAAEVCRRGLVFHPHDLRGRVLLGWALKEMGLLDDSASVLQEARAQVEENALLYGLLSQIAEAKGDVTQAARLLGVYEMIQGSMEAARQEEREEEPIRPSQVVKSTKVAFLAALLKHYEGKPSVSHVSPQRIFSDEARVTLRSMLRNRVR